MANKDSNKKGALAKDPQKPASNLKRLSPGVYRDPKGNLVDSKGKVIPRPGQKTAEKKDDAKKGSTGPRQPTQEQIVDRGFRQGADAYGNIIGQFQQFDPYQVQSKYQQGFTDEMNRARNSLMNQFERRNAEQFQREQLATQQQIAERGLDPNSPAAQALVRDLNDRQDRARQEAMNAAEQQAYGVQQQAYGQATGLAMMPYEQWSAIQAPYAAGVGNQYAQQQLQQQFGYEQQLAAQKQKYALELQRRAGANGGDPNAAAEAAWANYQMGQYRQQQPGQNSSNSFAQGVQQGGLLSTIKGS